MFSFETVLEYSGYMVGAIVAIALAIKIVWAIINWIESLIAGGSTRHASRSVEAISGPRPEAIGHKLEAIHMPPANRPRRQLTAYERDQLEPVSLGRRISDWWKRVNRLPSVYAMRSLRRKNRRNRVRESGGLNYDYRLQAGEHGTDLLPAPAANPARLMNALLVVLAQETLLGRVASAALDKESDVDGSIETYGAANFVFDLESMSLDQGKKNQALVPGTYWLRVIPLARGQKPVYVAELVILPPDPGDQDDDLDIELLRPASREGAGQATDITDAFEPHSDGVPVDKEFAPCDDTDDEDNDDDGEPDEVKQELEAAQAEIKILKAQAEDLVERQVEDAKKMASKLPEQSESTTPAVDDELDNLDIKIEPADDCADDLSNVDWGNNGDDTDDDEDDADEEPEADEKMPAYIDLDYFQVRDNGMPKLWQVFVWNINQETGVPEPVIIIYGAYTKKAPLRDDKSGDYVFTLEPFDGRKALEDLSVARDREGFPAYRIAGLDAGTEDSRLGSQHTFTVWNGDDIILEASITLLSEEKFAEWKKEHSAPGRKTQNKFFADREFTREGEKLFAVACGNNGAVVFNPGWTDKMPDGDEDVVEWTAVPLDGDTPVKVVPSISNKDNKPCVCLYALDDDDFVAECTGKRYAIEAVFEDKTILRVPVRMPAEEKYANGSNSNGQLRYSSGPVAPNAMAIALASARPVKPRPDAGEDEKVKPVRAEDVMAEMEAEKAAEAADADGQAKEEPPKKKKTPADLAAEKAAEAKKARAAKAAESKKQQDAGENLGELLTESADADPDDDATEPQTKGEQALVKAITNGSSKVVHSSGPEDNDGLTESQMVLALNGAVQSSEGDKPKEDEDTDEKLARARKSELEKHDSARSRTQDKRGKGRRRH